MKKNTKLPIGMTPMIVEERQMNASIISVYDRLMMDRIIFLGEGIDDYVANIINAQLLYLDSINNEPITLYINSPGGSVYSGLAIYDTMQHIKSPVHTCVTGLAASMGCILALAGEHGNRSALKHSRLMLHQPLGGTGYMQASDIDIYNKEIQILKSELIDIVKKHTGMKKSKIEKDMDRDYWLNSNAALEYKLIDEIIK